MKKLFTIGFLFTVLFISGFSVVYGETVLRINDSVSLSVDQTVHGDFYGFSGLTGPVSLSGTIEGDALVFGSTITANGTIEGDLLAIGGTTQVHASVTDDVRIVAGEITIAEHVGGDVVVLGGSLTILSSASVEGNVFFYGGEGELNGSVGGSVFGTSDALRIDGPVGGGVDVKVARTLVIGDRADISGDIRYVSHNEITRAQNAVVVGDVIQNSPESNTLNPREALVPFLVYAFSVLIIYVVFRNHLQEFMTGTLRSFTRNGLIGIVGVIFLPVAVALLFLTVIGSVIGLLGLSALLFLYISSAILSAIAIGALLNRVITKSEEVTLLWTLAGIVATEILFLIPILGPILVFTVAVVLFGSILLSLYKRITNI